ncbi:MAG: hypothetical protein ACLUR5_18210 [Eubacterium ventriosum]
MVRGGMRYKRRDGNFRRQTYCCSICHNRNKLYNFDLGDAYDSVTIDKLVVKCQRKQWRRYSC